MDGLSGDFAGEAKMKRNVLRLGLQAPIELHQVMRLCRISAAEGADYLSDLFDEGMITPFYDYDLLAWELTLDGSQLALSSEREPIDWKAAEKIINEITTKAILINSDPDRLHRISLRLFGSCLDPERGEYGDVDVAVEFIPRELPSEEKERIRAELMARAPNLSHANYVEKLFAADHTDKREILRSLKKGNPALSLMGDDPHALGFPYRWLVDGEGSLDLPLSYGSGIIRPNVDCDIEPTERLEQTLFVANYRPLRSDQRIATIPIYAADAEFQEAQACYAHTNGSRQLKAGDLADNPVARFSGYRNLCPTWREKDDPLDKLRKAFAWCFEHDAWPARVGFGFITINRDYRLRSIRYGIASELYVAAYPFSDREKGFQAELSPPNRKTMSKIDLAGAYAIADALTDIYWACGADRLLPIRVQILPHDDTVLPYLPKLKRTGRLASFDANGVRVVSIGHD